MTTTSEASTKTASQTTTKTAVAVDNNHRTEKQIQSSKQTKHILILINPKSGTGKSLSIYQKFLVPILDEHKQHYEVFISQDDFRVSDYFKNLSLERLNELSAIVVVSGDGLFHETVNALLNHKHWPTAVSIPLGIVPAGSGNGLAYTIIRRHKPNFETTSEAMTFACKQITDAHTTRADLIKVQMNSRKIWSFLSLGWGLMSDIDIESEVLRKIGPFRFTVFGLLKCITFKPSRGKLSYLEHKEQKRQQQQEDNNDNSTTTNWTHIEDDFTCVYAVYQSHISMKAKFAPNSTLSDGLIYLTFVRGNLTAWQTATFLTSIEDGSHERLPYVTVVPVTEFKLQPLVQSRVVIDGEDINWKLDDGLLEAVVEPGAINLLTK